MPCTLWRRVVHPAMMNDQGAALPVPASVLALDAADFVRVN
jgi:hypothetical protein